MNEKDVSLITDFLQKHLRPLKSNAAVGTFDMDLNTLRSNLEDR